MSSWDLILVFLKAFGFYLLPLSWACMEIEIEGRYGWAEKLPTWYRTEGGKIIKILKIGSGGRPINGYWFFAMIFWLLFAHYPFISGLAEWNMDGELKVFQLYIAFVAIEDLLWFVLNPHYTLKGYRPEKVWWHGQRDLKGFIIRDYLYALVIVLVFTGARSVWLKSFEVITTDVIFWIFILWLVVATVFFAPLYHEWYKKMRKKDHRSKAGIFPSGSSI